MKDCRGRGACCPNMRWRAPVAALALGSVGAASLAVGGVAPGLVLLAGAAAFFHPSIMARAFARATAWAALLPNVLVTVLLAAGVHHGPPLRLVLEMALAALALVVSRPLLATDRARASFAPLALRSWFLAAAIGAMSSALMLASLAHAFVRFGFLREVAGMSLLSGLLALAGVGVMRMRAWGVASGVIAAAASIPVVAAMYGSLLGLPVLLTAAPGALMGALVVAARAGIGHTKAEDVRVRVAPRVRVEAEHEEEIIEPIAEPAHAAHASQA
jgi:hypothetical protein